jgi:hypothetical protein
MDEYQACAVGCTIEVDGELYYRAAEDGRLCPSCFDRIRYRLDEAPRIVFELRASLVPIGAQKLEGRVTGTHEVPLPFRDDALDAADEVFSTLANWCLAHAGSMGVRPPDGLLAFRDAEKDALHLPANLSPLAGAERVAEVVSWLKVWAPSIAYLPGDDKPNPEISAKAYHDDVVQLVGRMRSKAGLSEPRRRLVDPQGWVCRVCGEAEGEIEVPDVGPMVAVCRGCRSVFPVEMKQRKAVAA